MSVCIRFLFVIMSCCIFLFFFFTYTATTEIYTYCNTLPLHDALPIYTATFVVNALQPATVQRVVIDEDDSRIEVVVPDDQLSLAIGRRGQNVRLASQLTGSQIDIMTEADASEKRQREFVERSTMFQEELDVDETLAQLLVAEGFGELEEVAYVPVEELAGIEGFDEELAQELQRSEEHTSELQSLMRIS